MKKILYITIIIGALALITNSCMKDLDTVPIDPDEVTSASVYENPDNYILVLAKLYAGLAVSGTTGPSGTPDISGIDEGFGQYLRGYWYMQELTTDEAVIAWNDQTIKNLHYQTWGSSDIFITAFYYRIMYQVSLCNEFLRETTDSKMSDHGFSDEFKAQVHYYRAEARFLRALSYWHALDLFANPPFVTENDPVGAFFPKQIQRADLYKFVESELLDIESQLMDPKQNEYGRADKAAAWMVLAKLYLNSEVYIGELKYTECITYCKKIIDAGYTLEAKYQNLFLADNSKLGEVIFSVNFDGINTRTWGGTTFIIRAAIGGTMNPADFGVESGWGGTRTTKQFVNIFGQNNTADHRAMFYSSGQNLEINDIGLFTDGWAITKWKNVDQNGNPGSHPAYPDTDFPMFRLADVYLMYAEAVLRGGTGGDEGTALDYFNDLRRRAYGNSNGEVSALDLELILRERAKELYWECQRRTDLIRYGKFTGGDYIWAWKGQVQDGIATDAHFNLFPIPAADLTANPNLVQNPGY